MMKHKDWLLPVLGASLLVANATLGRSQGLLPAILSAVLVPFVCVVLNRGLVRVSFGLFVIYGYALLLANDLLIRFLGGLYGSEVDCFLFLTFLAAFAFVTIGFWGHSFMISKEKRRPAWMALVICMILVWAEFSLFQATAHFDRERGSVTNPEEGR